MDETVVVAESSTNWGVIILFIILFILIIVIIIFAIWNFNTVNKNINLGGTCSMNGGGNCIDGLVCDNLICKRPIGGTCDHIADCISTATACQNSICVNTPLSGIGGTPPCQAGLINDNGICKLRLGGICSKDSDCSTGNICSNGKCKKDKHRGSSRSSDSDSSSSSRSSRSSQSSDSQSSDPCESSISSESSDSSKPQSSAPSKSPSSTSSKSPTSLPNSSLPHSSESSYHYVSNPHSRHHSKKSYLNRVHSNSTLNTINPGPSVYPISNNSPGASVYPISPGPGAFSVNDSQIKFTVTEEEPEKSNVGIVESMYNTEDDSLANIYKKIRSKTKYDITL